MIIKSLFKPAWWLTNPHAQTLYGYIKHPFQVPATQIEKIELPDGDFLSLVWSTADLSDDAPLIVILHGLGGSVNSSYVERFMCTFNNKGWRVVLMHFRGTGKETNRLPRKYHAGDTGDLDYLMRLLEKREPQTKKTIVGVSLGGNVLLKWLGEQGAQAKADAAIAVSVPFVLNDAANRMNEGFSRLYQKRILSEVRSSFFQKSIHFEHAPEVYKKALDCHCFWTFDQGVTAPLHGFSSVHSYYRECSSRQFLWKITTPTLIIHAKDDPFMTVDALPMENELSDTVVLELSEKGGHVGFISANRVGSPIYWLDQRITEYISDQLEQDRECEPDSILN